ncbi:MAG: UPF0262 family protein [Proteobacteria bacterium]|nr:UPF0262 family protein [Pseudomonadota bacterium]
MSGTQYIAAIDLDERSVVRHSPQVDHERRVAVFDLLESNVFDPADTPPGPYHLKLSIEDNRLVFDVRDSASVSLSQFNLPIGLFRRIVKDYFMICDSYFEAIKKLGPSQIEAIDMGRRGLHNEGADLLKERLAEKVAIDGPTARRLFTLVCVLHIRS